MENDKWTKFLNNLFDNQNNDNQNNDNQTNFSFGNPSDCTEKDFDEKGASLLIEFINRCKRSSPGIIIFCDSNYLTEDQLKLLKIDHDDEVWVCSFDFTTRFKITNSNSNPLNTNNATKVKSYTPDVKKCIRMKLCDKIIIVGFSKISNEFLIQIIVTPLTCISDLEYQFGEKKIELILVNYDKERGIRIRSCMDLGKVDLILDYTTKIDDETILTNKTELYNSV